MESTALGGIGITGSLCTHPLHHFFITLNLFILLGSFFLKFNLLGKQRKIILHKVAVKLLHVCILQMKHLIEAMIQQITVVSHCQQCTLVTVHQIFQTFQIVKIQESIRLIHDQQCGLSQHLTDYLQKLIFAAADGRHRQIFQCSQTCSL